MKALILLAGIGSRLHPLTLDKPKSLLELGEATIFEHMITKLRDCGIESFIIVCGHMQEIFESFVQTKFPELDIVFVRNELYKTTNTGYSLLMGRTLLEGKAFVKLDGDVIFDKRILERLLLTDDRASVVCIDHTSVSEENIKVICRSGGDIERIGNRIEVSKAAGESIGIEKINAACSVHLFKALAKMMETDANRSNYYEVAYDAIIQDGVIFTTLDITGLNWVEMDTHEDYQQALREFG